MPNSFTVFPNILPGNVTIGGNLTVSGDQLRIGAASPFVRLGKDAGPSGMLSNNIGFDGVTRDDAGKSGYRLLMRALFSDYLTQVTNPAGTQRNQAFDDAIFTDYTNHVHTGTTSLDTIYSKVIPANTLGANGGLRIRFQFTPTVQGGVAGACLLKIGGTTLLNVGTTTTQNRLEDLVIVNQNALNANLKWHADTVMETNATTWSVPNTFAVDFSVDNTLVVQFQSGAVGDSQTFHYITVEQINSFGPVS